MTTDSPHIFVAIPEGFGFKRLLGQKLTLITKNINNPRVSLLGDSTGLGKDYFNSRGLEPLSVTRERTPKKQLTDVTHAIFFWDGSEYSDLIHYAMITGLPHRVVAVSITSVVNKDKDAKFDVYIGRGTPWGNPFPIGYDADADSRADVIAKYKNLFYQEIVTDSTKLKALLSLKGKKLGCHCKPLPCHGDIIADFLNAYEPFESDDEI